MGLEVSLFRLVPLLLRKGRSSECESGVKYFLVQACGSVFLVGGVCMGGGFSGWLYVRRSFILGVISPLVIILGVILKLGVFPFHYWVPSVIAGIEWEMCFIVRVWQKLALLYVASNIIRPVNGPLLVVVGCLSSLVGGLGGMRQTRVRRLLGYSSVNHRG